MRVCICVSDLGKNTLLTYCTCVCVNVCVCSECVYGEIIHISNVNTWPKGKLMFSLISFYQSSGGIHPAYVCIYGGEFIKIE